MEAVVQLQLKGVHKDSLVGTLSVPEDSHRSPGVGHPAGGARPAGGDRPAGGALGWVDTYDFVVFDTEPRGDGGSPPVVAGMSVAVEGLRTLNRVEVPPRSLVALRESSWL